MGITAPNQEILNRTIQIAYHWDYTDREHFKKTGQHLDVKSETGYKRLDGYIYDELKEDVKYFASVNVNATIQKAWAKYKSSKTDVLRGDMSLPSYKSDQPLVLHAQSVKLFEEKTALYCKRRCFPTPTRKQLTMPMSALRSVCTIRPSAQ